MKVLFNKIYKLDQEYQECLIDENNFTYATYLDVKPETLNVRGITRENIFNIEPLNYYKIELKNNIPHDFSCFEPNVKLLEAGLIVSGIDKKTMTVFIYNCTNNHIYINENAVIGEIE